MMEYTKENHYSEIILKNKNTKPLHDFKRSKISIYGGSKEIVEVEINGETGWILESEFETLSRMNIKPSDIKVLTYTEGLFTPYGNKKGNSVSCVDGYELHIIY